MTGRIGNWDIGIINMQTEETDSLTSENFGVLRMREKHLMNVRMLVVFLQVGWGEMDPITCVWT